MSHFSRRDRLVADATTGVSHIMECFEKYFVLSGSRDLYKLFDDLSSSTTWKSGPTKSVKAIVGMYALFVEVDPTSHTLCQHIFHFIYVTPPKCKHVLKQT